MCCTQHELEYIYMVKDERVFLEHRRISFLKVVCTTRLVTLPSAVGKTWRLGTDQDPGGFDAIYYQSLAHS